MKCRTVGCSGEAKANPAHPNSSETSSLCAPCYLRWRRNGTAEIRICSEEGCGKRIRADNKIGLCAFCGRNPANRRTTVPCVVDGCGKRPRNGNERCRDHARSVNRDAFKAKRDQLFAAGVAGGLDCVLAGDSPLRRFHGFGDNLARSVFKAVHGTIPDGMWILHGCHDGNCVNVDHLYAGTPEENRADVAAIYRLGLEALRAKGVQVRHGALTDLPLGGH